MVYAHKNTRNFNTPILRVLVVFQYEHIYIPLHIVLTEMANVRKSVSIPEDVANFVSTEGISLSRFLTARVREKIEEKEKLSSKSS